MNPDRSSRLKELLLQSAALSEEERQAFLSDACKDDPELRRELETRLAHDRITQDHLRNGGAHAGDPTKASAPGRLIGQTVSHYKILELRGEGGMGLVYRALDLDLDREVALKCPWPHLVGDADCRRRFLHEARATSRVSHANIVQILEAFEAEGYPWLALQYVAGPDLGSLLASKGRLPVETVLRLGEDLASALKSAHDQGVLHRDIKPRNVLLTADDHALLGDFGLARLLPRLDADSTLSNQSSTVTPAGAVLGTPRYMSPEQALGRPVDKRSDIFSLGVLLYEMCTGRPAFSPSERGGLYDAIIHGEPEPIARFTYEIPEDLERIIRKAMAKPPDERYQDAGELLADLRALRRRREFKQYSEAHPFEPRGSPRRRRALLVWSAPIILLGAALVTYIYHRSRGDALPRSQALQVTRADEWAGQPAISPDGGRIAYASNVGGNYDIYVVDVHGGTPIRLTDDPTVDAYPDWFPDGRALAYASYRDGQASIWKCGQLGGGATLLLSNADQPGMSPDGTRLAFIRGTPGGYMRIGLVPVADTTRVRMLTDDHGGAWDHQHPAWSPDGRWICYATRHGLWIVSSSGGASRRLTREADLDQDPVWSPSGRTVYFSSYHEETMALWRVAVRGGAPERITLGDTRQCQPSISRDRSRLAYATEINATSLVIRNLETGKESAPPGLADAVQPAISPEQRRLVFVSSRGGTRSELWLQPLDGGEPSGPPRQLTDQPGDASHPAFSPDGRWIAYYRIIGEERDIWVISARGGQPLRFTADPASDAQPTWSPDGTMLAFISDRQEGNHIWVAPIRDGRPAGSARMVSNAAVHAVAPAWSPDGTQIAFAGVDSRRSEAWVVAADGQAPARQITQGASVTRVRWDPSRHDLLVCGTWGQDRYTLRRVSPLGGAARPLELPVDLGTDLGTVYFDVSTGGRWLVLTRTEMKGGIWLLEAQNGRY